MLIFLLPLLVGILVTPSLCDDPQNNCTSQLRDYRKIIEALLHPDQVMDIDAMNTLGETSLMIAARNGQTEIVKDLLKKNATIDLQNKLGATALMLAANKGHVETVEILLENKACPDLQDITGDTALKVAAEKGFTGVVRALLEHNASIEVHTGHTALIVIKALLIHNGTNDKQNEFSQTALKVAETLLKQNATLNIQTDSGYTGVQLSAYNGNEEVGEILAQQIYDVGFDFEQDTDITDIIAAKRHEGVVSLIINNTADLNNLVRIQFTAMQNEVQDFVKQVFLVNPAARGGYELHLANFQGHRDIVQLILGNKQKHCAQVFADEYWSFCDAIRSGRSGKQQMSAMVACEAVDDCRPLTALIRASLYGNYEVMEMLLNLNNDIEYVDFKDKRKWNALMHASSAGWERVVKLLLNHNATIDLQSDSDEEKATALYIAADRNHEGVVSVLLNNGAKPDIPTSKGSFYGGITPLMRAAGNAHSFMDMDQIKCARAMRIAENLLMNNASVNLQTWGLFRDTALMIAARGGVVELGRLLLKYNADARMKNDLGQTALDMAKQRGYTEFVNLLEEY